MKLTRFEREYCKANGIMTWGGMPEKYVNKKEDGEYENPLVQYHFEGYKMGEGHLSLSSRLSAMAINLEEKIQAILDKCEVAPVSNLSKSGSGMSTQTDFNLIKSQYSRLFPFDESIDDVEELQFYVNFLLDFQGMVIQSITGLKSPPKKP